jgi:hypothetical protein
MRDDDDKWILFVNGRWPNRRERGLFIEGTTPQAPTKPNIMIAIKKTNL